MTRSRRLPSRGLMAIGLLAVVLVVLAIASRSRVSSGVEGPTLSMHVTSANGGRALYLWLAETGYDVRPLQYRSFHLSDETDALFILAPTNDLNVTEVTEVLGWVERGGTLFVAAEQHNRLLDELGVVVRFGSDVLQEAVPLQPVFVAPSLDRVVAETRVRLDVPNPTWVAVLGSGDVSDGPIAATAGLGNGRIHILTSEFLLTNAGIGRGENAAYIHHVLADVPHSGTILFDEYHHGLTEHGTLSQRLVREPWGWAVIWIAAYTFVWLALSGKRFGKALSPPPTWARRSSAEYVQTLASAMRRGNHGRWLRDQYVAQTKRAFGGRFQVRADQSAREFMTDLTARRNDMADLAVPLERLEGPNVLEDATTLELMREVDAIARRMGIGR